MLQTMDSNKDGVITIEEFIEACRKVSTVAIQIVFMSENVFNESYDSKAWFIIILTATIGPIRMIDGAHEYTA